MTDIYVRVEEPGGGKREMGGRQPPSLPMEKFADRAPEVAAGLVQIADQLKSQLEALADRDKAGAGLKLDTVGLSFDLGLEAEAGLLIARGSASAAFGVTIAWKR